MTFEEAFNRVRYFSEEFRDSGYYPGGYEWSDWCAKTQQSLGRSDIIEDVFRWESAVRKPYYRMRGKPVTEEQAKEIILRTRTAFSFEEEPAPDNIRGMNFWNEWFDNPKPAGWCHPDGTIGIDWNMGKYPHSHELLVEFFGLACEFPFLDLVIVITNHDECPAAYADHLLNGASYPDEKALNWRSGAEIGVWLKNGCFGMLGRDEALALYDEYDRKYGISQQDSARLETNIFDTRYYSVTENKNKLDRFSYLKSYQE